MKESSYKHRTQINKKSMLKDGLNNAYYIYLEKYRKLF